MFNKVFKYDFKYVFRFWWIYAVSTLGVSVLSGLLLRYIIGFFNSPNPTEIGGVIGALCILGFMATVFSIALLPAAASIGCAVRYYKNFFSDEGYLTFTLPVSRTTLLNSKIVNDIAFSVISLLILLIDALIIIFIGCPPLYLEDAISALNHIHLSAEQSISIVLAVLAMAASLLMGICVLFLSITIGSVISKNHKVLAGIGVYYGITAILSGIQQLFSLLPNLAYIASPTPSAIVYLLFAIFLYLAFGLGAYFVNLYCLKNKLNLS